MGDASAFEWTLVLRFCYISEAAKGETQAHCCVHVYHVLNVINKEVKSSEHLLIQPETHKSERLCSRKHSVHGNIQTWGQDGRHVGG